ncbi:hypothetical protein COV82_03460 [Candidatus Peregrinibacteria bacterium CG11_big_fil_rev_8_21_14_0_20_46_8]|nr:MAG: hypothetical protein COV82_03460 [Candidatus Peregrinibacteria bacterium CG11_big_fil_rev_8_21_14_0_20_46_8]
MPPERLPRPTTKKASASPRAMLSLPTGLIRTALLAAAAASFAPGCRQELHKHPHDAGFIPAAPLTDAGSTDVGFVERLNFCPPGPITQAELGLHHCDKVRKILTVPVNMPPFNCQGQPITLILRATVETFDGPNGGSTFNEAELDRFVGAQPNGQHVLEGTWTHLFPLASAARAFAVDILLPDGRIIRGNDQEILF